MIANQFASELALNYSYDMELIDPSDSESESEGSNTDSDFDFYKSPILARRSRVRTNTYTSPVRRVVSLIAKNADNY